MRDAAMEGVQVKKKPSKDQSQSPDERAHRRNKSSLKLQKERKSNHDINAVESNPVEKRKKSQEQIPKT